MPDCRGVQWDPWAGSPRQSSSKPPARAKHLDGAPSLYAPRALQGPGSGVAPLAFIRRREAIVPGSMAVVFRESAPCSPSSLPTQAIRLLG